MDKKEFLRRLSCALIRLPEYDRAEAVSFYDEIISDKVEAGMREQDAVASLGDINSLRAYITAASVENSLLGRGELSAPEINPETTAQTTVVSVADNAACTAASGSKGDTPCRCGVCGGIAVNAETSGNVNNTANNYGNNSACGANSNGNCSANANNTEANTTANVSPCANSSVIPTKTASISAKPETKIEKVKRKIKGVKAPLKSFFTMLAVCTSPILVILGVTFVIVLGALLISFAAMGAGLVACAAGAIVYGVVTAGLVAGSYGAAAGAMTFFAYLFASAVFAIIAVWLIKVAQVIIKSVVLLFARLIKKNKRGKLTAKEGA